MSAKRVFILVSICAAALALLLAFGLVAGQGPNPEEEPGAGLAGEGEVVAPGVVSAGTAPQWPGPESPAAPETNVGSAFAYHGRLVVSGIPANGAHDFLFTLYDANFGGNQVSLTVPRTLTVNHGLFVTLLDFGPTAFNGQQRWLEIQVRPAGVPPYSTLVPRQPMDATPYALSLRPGAIVSGVLPGIPALTLQNTGIGGDGLMVADAADIGVYVTQPGSSAYYADGGTVGFYSDGASTDGLVVNAPSQYGVYVTQPGSSAYYADGGTVGFWSEGASSDGIYVNAPSQKGATLWTPGDSGLFVFYPGGDGVEVLGAGEHGVLGQTISKTHFGGYFVNTASPASGDGAALFAQGNTNVAIDMVLGGSQGRIAVDDRFGTASMYLHSNEDVFVHLNDGDQADLGEFIIYGSNNLKLLEMEEDNDFFIYDDDGTPTIQLEGTETLTDGGEISIFTDVGTRTIVLDGDFNGEGWIRSDVVQITGGSDLSEQFDVGSRNGTAPEAGQVVCIDVDNPGRLVVCDSAYARTVAGVISGAGGVKPGLLMGQAGSRADGAHAVALTGRVYVWVDAGSGPVVPGDLLTSSTVPGYAMKVDDHGRAQGAILGKAMTGLESGQGLVLVLVTLQ